jgi:alkylhydroperoxidase family enzyme
MVTACMVIPGKSSDTILIRKWNKNPPFFHERRVLALDPCRQSVFHECHGLRKRLAAQKIDWFTVTEYMTLASY